VKWVKPEFFFDQLPTVLDQELASLFRLAAQQESISQKIPDAFPVPSFKTVASRISKLRIRDHPMAVQ
jgi:hypothetical protein